MRKYEYEKKLTYRILIFTMYTYFMYILLPYLDIVINLDYISNKVHGFVLSIIPILIFLEFFCLIYYSILSAVNKETVIINKESKIYKYLKNSLLFLTIIISIAFFIFEEKSMSTGGIFCIQDKIIEENKYFVIVDDKKIKCNENEYNLIKEEVEYVMSFKWNERIPDIGYLQSISPFEDYKVTHKSRNLKK